MPPIQNQSAQPTSQPAVKPLFAIGRLVATPGAIGMLHQRKLSPFHFVSRHLRGDWGDLDGEDKRENQSALANGTRIFSSYQIDEKTKLWIITEADRSATTLLLPEEY